MFLPNSRKANIYLLLIVVVGVGFALFSMYKKFVHDEPIRAGQSGNIGQHLNIHSSGSRWLEVDSVKYRDIVGYSPYYLEVPNTDLIFFVQNSHGGGRVAHFVSTKSKQHYKFENLDDYTFSYLGGAHPGYIVRVEDANMKEVIIVDVFEDCSTRYVFNFADLSVKVE